ncbi:hypothetical protein BDV19DRAFT_385858 [Aspergillus venezuelensis]
MARPNIPEFLIDHREAAAGGNEEAIAQRRVLPDYIPRSLLPSAPSDGASPPPSPLREATRTPEATGLGLDETGLNPPARPLSPEVVYTQGFTPVNRAPSPSGKDLGPGADEGEETFRSFSLERSLAASAAFEPCCVRCAKAVFEWKGPEDNQRVVGPLACVPAVGAGVKCRRCVRGNDPCRPLPAIFCRDVEHLRGLPADGETMELQRANSWSCLSGSLSRPHELRLYLWLDNRGVVAIFLVFEKQRTSISITRACSKEHPVVSLSAVQTRGLDDSDGDKAPE